jgi:hypothetical protein
MLDPQPNLVDSHGSIQAWKSASRMLVQLRRAAESPIVPQPCRARREPAEERVNLLPDFRIQLRNDAMDIFEWPANFFLETPGRWKTNTATEYFELSGGRQLSTKESQVR